jgi:hypothetical protein
MGCCTEVISKDYFVPYYYILIPIRIQQLATIANNYKDNNSGKSIISMNDLLFRAAIIVNYGFSPLRHNIGNQVGHNDSMETQVAYFSDSPKGCHENVLLHADYADLLEHNAPFVHHGRVYREQNAKHFLSVRRVQLSQPPKVKILRSTLTHEDRNGMKLGHVSPLLAQDKPRQDTRPSYHLRQTESRFDVSGSQGRELTANTKLDD